MEIAVMERAERHHEFVADFLRHAPALGKAEMMGVGGLAIADHAGEFAHTLQVSFIADPAFKSQPKFGFIDAQSWSNPGRGRWGFGRGCFNLRGDRRRTVAAAFGRRR